MSDQPQPKKYLAGTFDIAWRITIKEVDMHANLETLAKAVINDIKRGYFNEQRVLVMQPCQHISHEDLLAKEREVAHAMGKKGFR